MAFLWMMVGAMGCLPSKPVATPADLDRLGTRRYADHDRDAVMKATLTALKVLGYEVVTTDPRIRTSPRDVATTAHAQGAGNTAVAQGFTEAVAWDIDVRTDGAGAVLHAVPRATVNGQAMDQVWLDWAERNFGQLMNEIDASFGAK
jgi:hypothetical protein